MSRSALNTLVTAKILSGGRRTTAANEREVYNAIIAEALNPDDANVAGGYMKIDLTGIVDVSFIKSATPSGLFLRDDGTWSAASGGASDLESVLTIGNNTGGYSIVSPDLSSQLNVVDTQALLGYYGVSISGEVFGSLSGSGVNWSDGVNGGSLFIIDTDLTITHSALLSFISNGANLTLESGTSTLYSNNASVAAPRLTLESGGLARLSSVNGVIEISGALAVNIVHTALVAFDAPEYSITNIAPGSYLYVDISGKIVAGTAPLTSTPSLADVIAVNGAMAGAPITSPDTLSTFYLTNALAQLDWQDGVSQGQLYFNSTNLGLAWSDGTKSAAFNANLTEAELIHSDNLTINAGVVNIGTRVDNTVINYGNSSTVHNFLGSALYEYQANQYVLDKLITLNYGGAAASGIGVGFEIEENSIITGYLKTNGSRTGFSFLAPVNAAATDFVFSSTSARTKTFQDSTSTMAEYANKLSVFAATTSAELAGVISDETGSGLLVFNTSPTIETSLLLNYASASQYLVTDASKNVISRTISQVQTDLLPSFRKKNTTQYEAWYTTPTSGVLTTNASTQARNTLRLFPFIVNSPMTLDKIGVKITVGSSSAGSVMRLGIYDTVAGLPKNLVIDAGTVAYDAAAFAQLNCAVTLQPGLYWLAMNNDGVNQATLVIGANASCVDVLGHDTTNSITSTIRYLTSAETFAAFTADISGYTFTPQLATGCPLIYVRISA